jgi:hypothetical protein
MHEYVQKSTRTTLPRSSRIVSGRLPSQASIPTKSGAAPKSGSATVCGFTLAARATPPPAWVSFRSSRFATLLRSTGFCNAFV